MYIYIYIICILQYSIYNTYIYIYVCMYVCMYVIFGYNDWKSGVWL